MYPADLKFTKDHEWVRLSGDGAQVGITDYAQKQLGDVVYLELPDVGRSFKKGDVFGTIESVKSVSELYCPAERRGRRGQQRVDRKAREGEHRSARVVDDRPEDRRFE